MVSEITMPKDCFGEKTDLLLAPRKRKREKKGRERKEKNRVKGIHGTMRVALSSITESWAR